MAAKPKEPISGADVLDRPDPSLYNARALNPCPLPRAGAQVAQLVEHVTENHGVGGSIPPLGTTLTSLSQFCEPRHDPA
jgi:hypothetical protein